MSLPYVKTTEQSYAKEETFLNSSGSITTQGRRRLIGFEWVDSFNGVKLQGWQKKIAQHKQATTEASGFRNRLFYSPSYVHSEYYTNLIPVEDDDEFRRSRQSWGAVIYTTQHPLSVNVSDMTDADNKAREQFYKNVRNAQTSMSGGVFLGELMQTYRMLRRPAESMRKQFKDYVRALERKEKHGARFKTVKKANAWISGTYLEYMFGVRPLISDSESAIKAMEKSDRYPDARYYIRAKGVSTQPRELIDTKDSTVGHIGLSWPVYRWFNDVAEYRGSIGVNPSQQIRKLGRWGVDSSNIIPTIWELVPYSFLVDYFTNVGKVLDAYAVQNVRLRWGCRTLRRASIVECGPVATYQHIANVRITAESVSFGKWREESTSFTRTPVLNVDEPDFRFTLPVSPFQWGNMVALASQWRNKKLRILY